MREGVPVPSSLTSRQVAAREGEQARLPKRTGPNTLFLDHSTLEAHQLLRSRESDSL